MANLLLMLLKHPLQTLIFSHSFLSQILLVLLRRLLLPHFPIYQSLRVQLQRAYLSSASISFPDLTHRLPVSAQPVHRARKLDHNASAYLIPGSTSLESFSHAVEAKGGRRKCVALYAHGGGYARGEALMYLNYMERWIQLAASAHIDLAFVSVEYPLSMQASHPAQMNVFIDAYRNLLDHHIAPSNIVFMGDSAGGGLNILSAVELKRRGLPQPAAAVLISPWIDMTLDSFNGGNSAVESDYFVQANDAINTLVRMFIGPDREGDWPDINPIYAGSADLQGLCPQLMLVGGAEFALSDSKQWATACSKAGVKHSLTVEWGQLHIYAMGSKWIDSSVRKRTEDKIVAWIGDHIAG